MTRRTGFGWLALLEGILMVALGILTFVRPDGALTGMIVLYAAVAVITGVCDIIFYVRAERYTGFGPTVALITGILSVMAGVMLLLYPNAGKWILSLLFPLWFLAHCIFRLSNLNFVRLWAGRTSYFISLAANLLGLVLGVLMLLRPVVSLLAVSYLVGLYLIVMGVESIAVALSRLGGR